MGNKNEPMSSVNHDFEFHAEIKYETENGFGYTSAVGNTVKELIEDIKGRMNDYRDREPELVEVVYRPNDNYTILTEMIKRELESENA
tara:strand:+ start:2413 stop:2676 length:264 start_codon:yes stop_codon:yes gene_type:complete